MNADGRRLEGEGVGGGHGFARMGTDLNLKRRGIGEGFCNLWWFAAGSGASFAGVSRVRVVYSVCAAACLLVVGQRCAFGQSQPVVGVPSIPFAPVAQAQSGGAGPQVTYQHGIEFVTVGGAGNAPWAGNGTEGDTAIGRGSVAGEYRMSRFEITTAQWVSFFNAAFDRPQSEWVPHVAVPTEFGGAQQVVSPSGGMRWEVVPGREMLPAGGITWRTAAVYCNWLCNNQGSARSAFLTGAYDVGTFGYIGTDFSDQAQHTPGAAFWIPTLDEWVHAAHYDPNRNGQGAGGYWEYSISRDTAPRAGPPVSVPLFPAGETNSGYSMPGWHEFDVPLGAYGGVQSPWGLLDTAGGTSEWLEDVIGNGQGQIGLRGLDGSAWSQSPAAIGGDLISSTGGDIPSIPSLFYGFRIAASVPAPGCAGSFLMAFVAVGVRRRR